LGWRLFLFEKVRGVDARFHDMLNLAYLEYKSKSGYTYEEILGKMFSLKGVLEPFTTTENFKFLERAGFKDFTIVYKNLCFEGILAIK
jgi:tRNA (cmo5U34)-methyltransferase